MKLFFTSYLASLVTLAILDGIWLKLIARSYYKHTLQHLLAPNVRWVPVILFYLLYAAGLSLLVVLPQAKLSSGTAASAFGYGALLGFIAYAAYDLTNLATLNRWPVAMSSVDLAWGTCMTGVASLIAFLVLKRFWS